MTIIAGGAGALLLVLAFRQIGPTVQSGVAIGGYWLAINWVLDFLILLPISGMSAGAYFYDIGLRYLLIPIMAVAIGKVAKGRS